jgi:hypothetical protein
MSKINAGKPNRKIILEIEDELTQLPFEEDDLMAIGNECNYVLERLFDVKVINVTVENIE